MPENIIKPIKRGIVGSIILGIGGMLFLGKRGGTLATITGLISGSILHYAWVYFQQKRNPVICLECGSKEIEMNRKKLGSREITKPVHRSDLMEYTNTYYFGKEQSLINRVEEIIVSRITYEEVNRCKNCGLIHSKKIFCVDNDIYLSDIRSAVC